MGADPGGVGGLGRGWMAAPPVPVAESRGMMLCEQCFDAMTDMVLPSTATLSGQEEACCEGCWPETVPVPGTMAALNQMRGAPDGSLISPPREGLPGDERMQRLRAHFEAYGVPWPYGDL